MPFPALLLTAGLGTRLDPLTRVRAKPAVPLAGEPLARRIVQWLVHSGVTAITCNLHHLPHTLTAVLGDGADLGARIRYSWEQPALLGSAGGPRQALDIIGAEQFFLVNGDTLTDAPLDQIADAHARSGALVTMALTPNLAPSRYGGVLLDDGGCVVGFARRGPAAAGSFHFIGVQLAAADVFRPIPQGTVASTVGGIYDRLILNRPGSVRGIVVKASFLDVGTVNDYLRTSEALATGRLDRGARVHCAPSAQVMRTIVWDDVAIGEHALLDACIVTDGVVVPDGAAFTSAVLLNDDQGQLQAIPFSADR